PTQYRFYFIVEKLAALITDLILSQNYEDIATAKKLGLCTPEKLRYLGNGIDIDHLGRNRLNPIHQSELRQSLGIPETANLMIGTIGRLTRKKGSAILIEATAKLLDRFPNLHVIIIGGEINKYTEPFQKELIEKIHDLGIKQHVTFTGIRFDIPEILGLLDVFTLPTFAHEGLPRSILEAMAMELPVVTTDIRGCREAVLQEKTGLIVPPQDSDKLAEALAIMLSNSELRQDYGKAGRYRVTTKYNEELVFERLTKYYQGLGIQ
ncbi:MAG: glycosyltransferase, partial [Waterburya sp.]